MIIENIIKIEDNKNIYLHNEGLFWRVYEYSAYAFLINIKQYNAKKKFIKKVGGEIVFLGFPDIILVNTLDLCKQNDFVVNKNYSTINIKPDKKNAFALQPYTLPSRSQNPPPKPKLVNKYACLTAQTKTPSC